MSDFFGNIAKNVINRDNLCSCKCDRVEYFIAFDGWLGAPGFGFVEYVVHLLFLVFITPTAENYQNLNTLL